MPHLHSEKVRLLDCVLRIGAGGVQEGQNTQEPPPAVLVILARDGQRADSARAELVHLPADKLNEIPKARRRGQRQSTLRST